MYYKGNLELYACGDKLFLVNCENFAFDKESVTNFARAHTHRAATAAAPAQTSKLHSNSPSFSCSTLWKFRWRALYSAAFLSASLDKGEKAGEN